MGSEYASTTVIHRTVMLCNQTTTNNTAFPVTGAHRFKKIIADNVRGNRRGEYATWFRTESGKSLVDFE